MIDMVFDKSYFNQLLVPIWLFGFCVILHAVSGYGFEGDWLSLDGGYVWLELMTFFCALSMVLRPQWVMPTVVVSFLCIFKYLLPLDYNSNSVFLIFSISLVFLSGYLIAFVSHCVGRLAVTDICERAAEFILPGLRALLVVMYFYGIFHKINAGWFDIDNGCAVRWWEDIYSPYLRSFLDYTAFRWFVIWAPLLLELLFMVGLFTRGGMKYLSMVGGVFFHLFIGFSSFRLYWAFSVAVLILYSAFLPPDFLHRCALFFSKKRKWMFF